MRRFVVILPLLFAACASAPSKPVSYATPQPSATVASSADRQAIISGSTPTEAPAFIDSQVPGGP